MKTLPSVGIGVAGVLAFSTLSRAQLTFNVSYDPGIDVRALAGLQAAADLWSSVLTDTMAVNLDISFSALPDRTLALTYYNFDFVDYGSLRSALAADATSASDARSVAALPAGTSYSVLVNHSNWAANDDRFYATRDHVLITTANAKALGLGLSAFPSPGADASIAFSSTLAFDFDQSDGIDPDKYDFTGVAAHEIGHALGFDSASLWLDWDASLADTMTAAVLDLNRYSTLSGGTIDITADRRPKYFSIDGGTTDLAEFSTGVDFGDGYQAGHWKNNQGLGLMDPTFATGELAGLTELDLTAFDVLGYDLAAVPEPASFALALGASAGLLAWWRRRQRGRE